MDAALPRRPPARRRCSCPIESGTPWPTRRTTVGWCSFAANASRRSAPRGQVSVPADAVTITLPGTTLMPGLIEGHSHLLLHPYNETPWDDQVLHESLALRVARAVNHARATLMAGFHDGARPRHRRRGLRRRGTQAGDQSRHHPRPAHAGRDARDRRHRPVRAQRISRPNTWTTFRRAPRKRTVPTGFTRVVRDQIKHGADWIKVYADYRWGPNGETMPGFTQEEFNTAVNVAKSSGRSGRRARHDRRGNAPRRTRRCRDDRARRQRNAGSLQAHGGARRVLRADRLGRWTQQVDRAEVRARRRRDDLQRRRLRSARARRQREGSRRARDERPHAAASSPRRDGERREDAPLGGSHRSGESRDCSPISSR